MAVPLLRPHDATDIFLHADYVGGYGWLFPKGPTANLGIGTAPEARPLLKPLLAALHRRLVAEGRVGLRRSCLIGGAIPVGGRLAACAAIGDMPVLLAGDAAGLTNPVTGAGIAAAVLSGKLAGQAAAGWLSGGRARSTATRRSWAISSTMRWRARLGAAARCWRVMATAVHLAPRRCAPAGSPIRSIGRHEA